MSNECMSLPPLKICPACKNLPIMEYCDDFDPFRRIRYFRIACCGIVGEASTDPYKAIEAWNRKVGESNE